MALESSDWLAQETNQEGHVGSVLATHHVIKLVGNKLLLSSGEVIDATVRTRHFHCFVMQDKSPLFGIVAVSVFPSPRGEGHDAWWSWDSRFPASHLLCRRQPPRYVTVFEFPW